jgi:hypothetical protein
VLSPKPGAPGCVDVATDDESADGALDGQVGGFPVKVVGRVDLVRAAAADRERKDGGFRIGIVTPDVILQGGELGGQGDVVVDLEHRLDHELHGAEVIGGVIFVQVSLELL